MFSSLDEVYDALVEVIEQYAVWGNRMADLLDELQRQKAAGEAPVIDGMPYNEVWQALALLGVEALDGLQCLANGVLNMPQAFHLLAQGEQRRQAPLN